MKPVQTLGQEYSMEILGATGNPTSATHLSESLDIPIATCYRRVEELATVGFLEKVTSDEDGTHRATRYQRTTDAVGIRFAPIPSLYAWTCIGEAVGADVSALTVAAHDQTSDRVRSVPLGTSTQDTAVAATQPGSTENDE
jgi:hypothetical protein